MKKRTDHLFYSSHFFTLLDSFSLCGQVLDCNGKILSVSRSWLEHSGYSREEVISRNFSDFLPEPDKSEFYRIFPEFLSSGNFHEKDISLICRSGDHIRAHFSCLVTGIEPDIRIQCVFQDISMLQKTKNLLLESESRYQALFNSVDSAIFVFEFSESCYPGKIIEFNDTACRLLSYSREELKKLSFSDLEMSNISEDITHLLEMVKNGAGVVFQKNYLTKSKAAVPVEIHARQFTYQNRPALIATVSDISFRVESEKQLRRLAAAVEQTTDSVTITDVNSVIEYVNPAFEKTTGFSSSEVIGRKMNLLSSGSHDRSFFEKMWKTLRSGSAWSGRIVNRCKNGNQITEETAISPLKSESGRLLGFLCTQKDITRELAIEEKLRYSQRMECVGRLAGTVAHEFNNMLQVITGYSEMAVHELPQGHPAFCSLSEVLKAGSRSRDLVRQLLSFSRQQIMRPEIIDLNRMLSEMNIMFQKTLGETYSITFTPHQGLDRISADRELLQQVMMNIVLNARDFMPEGGKIEFSTKNISLDHDFCARNGLQNPGNYICISISDHGCGIEKKNLQKIFEPFFTTKQLGQGAGLGLSSSAGIIAQHNVLIRVESEAGQGSVFHIYLPSIARFSTGSEPVLEKPECCGKNEMILLVEDDEMVREFTSSILEKTGYQVLSASDAREALKIFSCNRKNIDLLLSDVIMPGMSGRELFEEIAKVRPGLPAVFITGYQSEVLPQNFLTQTGTRLLQKPFSTADILKTVREVLDQKSPANRVKIREIS